MNKENNVGLQDVGSTVKDVKSPIKLEQDVRSTVKSRQEKEAAIKSESEIRSGESAVGVIEEMNDSHSKTEAHKSATHEEMNGSLGKAEVYKFGACDSGYIDIKDWGFSEDLSEYNGLVARVIAEHRERYTLICQYGEVSARLKTKEYYKGDEPFPTVGDFVLINYSASSDSLITKTLPRTTYFSRRDPDRTRGEQAVAANFDYVMILQSQNHDFNPKRLERYLSSAYQSGAVPVVVLTKSDLSDDENYYIATSELYAAGAEVISVSAHTGCGLERLKKYLQGSKTLVFLGSSGVGKSSLVNALACKDIMTTNGIREDDSKGRHTTTHRQMIMLDCGAMIIDTPGMRELGMWEASEGITMTFPEIEALLGKCKYRNCRHKSEPGCAILEAIESGKLSAERWERYRSLVTESQISADKAEYLKSKRDKFKQISIMNKKAKSFRK